MIRPDIMTAARREVGQLSLAGKLVSPRDAWLMSGHMGESETLWSVAQRYAQRFDCSAEELCRYLEHHYPQHTNLEIHRNQDWHDLSHGGC